MLFLPRQFLILKEIRFSNVAEHITKAVSTYCYLCNKETVNPKRSIKTNQSTSGKLIRKSGIGFSPPDLLLESSKDNTGFTGEQDKKKAYRGKLSSAEILAKHATMVDALSNYFECSQDTSVMLIQKYNFLTKLTIEAFTTKLNVLLESGVTKQELLSDLWILTYTIPTIEERLNLLKQLNLTPVKPWLLRCSPHILARMSRNRENNRIAMGPYGSVADYLKIRLEMTESQKIVFSMKHPPVTRVKVAKLKEIIDFLFSEGFTPLQIYHTPRILCHSLLTIQERLKQLRALNYKPHSLLVLCKSKRSFHKFITTIEREKQQI